MDNIDYLRLLQKKYPLFYSTDPICGFFLPEGWYHLVDELSEKIEKINEELISKGYSPFICNQVKEKFAALRIYAFSDNSTEEYSEMVSDILFEYELKSKSICEISGESGAYLYNCNGWLRTLSEKNAEMLGAKKVVVNSGFRF